MKNMLYFCRFSAIFELTACMIAVFFRVSFETFRRNAISASMIGKPSATEMTAFSYSVSPFFANPQ